MSEEIVGAYAVTSNGHYDTTVEKRVRTRYEVWTNKTLVLRTIHETQAIRYAREVQGEVRTLQQSGWSAGALY